MLVGYLRAFSGEDSASLNMQRRLLTRAGVSKHKIFLDKTLNRGKEAPQLIFCLNSLKSGDTLIVWRLDRLGNFKQQLHILTRLKKTDIDFRVLTGFNPDSSHEGETIFDAFFSLAEQIGFLSNIDAK